METKGCPPEMGRERGPETEEQAEIQGQRRGCGMRALSQYRAGLARMRTCGWGGSIHSCCPVRSEMERQRQVICGAG